MGHFRFRDRIKILPGVHVNVGKTGVSLSIGPPGATTNISRHGVRSTVGLPGSGMSYSHYEPHSQGKQMTPPPLPEVSEDRAMLENVANLFPEDPEDLFIYFWLNETQCGPYSGFQMFVMLANRTIEETTLFWVAENDEWKPVSTLPVGDIVRHYRKIMDMS